MRIFTGDLEPALELTLAEYDENRVQVDINAESATSIRIIGTLNGTEIFDRAPTTTEHTGLVTVMTMDWEDGDTDLPGRILLEVEINWPGDRPQTIRPQKYVSVVTDHDAVVTP